MDSPNKACLSAHRSGRRDFLTKAGLLGAAAAIPSTMRAASLESPAASGQQPNKVTTRRKLATLEVSSVGLGVQSMARKYSTTVPYRPEMVSVIRGAYDQGVTFFDTAEAYGPLECERILGESIAPFRNKVKITTKCGFGITQTPARCKAGSTVSRNT